MRRAFTRNSLDAAKAWKFSVPRSIESRSANESPRPGCNLYRYKAQSLSLSLARLPVPSARFLFVSHRSVFDNASGLFPLIRPLFVLRQFLVAFSLSRSDCLPSANSLIVFYGSSPRRSFYSVSPYLPFFFHSNSLAVIVVDRHTDVGTRERRTATRSSVKSVALSEFFFLPLARDLVFPRFRAWKNRASRRFKNRYTRTGSRCLRTALTLSRKRSTSQRSCSPSWTNAAEANEPGYGWRI